MSVLVCPVCQASMRETNKNGVLIDVCTQCRGVWLDRGELEKLASVFGGGGSQGGFFGGAARPQRRNDDDDDDRRYGRGQPQQRRKSFLDFFD